MKLIYTILLSVLLFSGNVLHTSLKAVMDIEEVLDPMGVELTEQQIAWMEQARHAQRMSAIADPGLRQHWSALRDEAVQQLDQNGVEFAVIASAVYGPQ